MQERWVSCLEGEIRNLASAELGRDSYCAWPSSSKMYIVHQQRIGRSSTAILYTDSIASMCTHVSPFVSVPCGH